MSVLNKLTEGIVNRDLSKEGAALVSKWGKTGLLEGLQGQKRESMSRLLENQARELLREASTMSAGDVEGFAAVAFPIVRRVFAGLIANDLVSVQPMSLPSGLIFFLDFTFSPDLGASADAYDSRFGNLLNRAGTDAPQSIYGSDRVGSQVTGGVNIVDSTLKSDQSGPRGMVGGAYASPTGSNSELTFNNAAHVQIKDVFHLDGDLTDARAKMIKFDPDLMQSGSLTCIVVDVEVDMHNSTEAKIDFDNLAAFSLTELADRDTIASGDFRTALNATSGIGTLSVTNCDQVRRLTQQVDADEAATTAKAVRYFIVSSEGHSNYTEGTSGNLASANITAGHIKFPLKDHIPVGGSVGAVQSASSDYALENNADIPEIDIKVDSIAITAQTKKLKAKWSPELGQDLNAYHNIDAEVELTSILSEQIALEIDREILADLVNGAKAGTYYWSRSPGLFVNRTTGAELGATSAAPDFTGTVSEWYETLIETMNDVSAQIHIKTLRGGANFCVVSPEVANILEFTSGFRANVTADADKGDIGAVKVGALSRKFDVIVDPYFPRNVVLMGRKGASFLESGYVYAPYVPLMTTPTIFGVEDFVPRKGVMTRYAKKMVRPDMYGLVIVRGLIGEEGS